MIDLFLKQSFTFNIEVNSQDQFGQTAFHYACKYYSVSIVHMLVEKSAQANIDLNAKDRFGQTAFHLSCKNDHLSKIGKEDDRNAIIQLLIEKQRELNLELNAKSENGETVLHYACKNVLPKIAKLLIQVNIFQKLFFHSVGIKLLLNFMLFKIHVVCVIKREGH